jgi:hypothetical protein
MNPQDIIYPSDVKAAREAAIARNPSDLNGYGAMRINFAGKKEPKGGRVTYYPWEINLADGRGWKKVDKLYFMNLKHVGKVSELMERSKQGGVPDIALLFKGDYTYKRLKTLNGHKVEVLEEYGSEKEWLSRAFVAHVKKHQQKDEFSRSAQVRVNVKHERETKDKNGKIVKEPIIPSNINISIPFKGIDGNDALKKDPKTKFQCEILDVERKKALGSFDPKKEWPFEMALVRGQVKTDLGMVNTPAEELCNGNIHKFLRGGSECSGFDNMGDVCLSNMGISNPSKVQVLMVKQSMTQSVSPTSISSDDLDMIGGGSSPAATAPVEQTFEIPMPDGSFNEVATAVNAEAFTGGDGFDTSTNASDTFEF